MVYLRPRVIVWSALEKHGTVPATGSGPCSSWSNTVTSDMRTVYLISTISSSVGLGPSPALTTSKPFTRVCDQATPAAIASSAATPIHSSHSPPLLTGRNGTVVTLIVADPSLAPAGANVGHAYRRTERKRSRDRKSTRLNSSH